MQNYEKKKNYSLRNIVNARSNDINVETGVLIVLSLVKDIRDIYYSKRMINDFSPSRTQTKVVLFEKREQTIHSTQQYCAQLKIQK